MTDVETAWWAGLSGDDIRLNTEGDPPYDVGRVAEFLRSRLVDPDRVLDVGCGTGRLARVYQRLTQARVVGVDPSPNVLARAREHAPEVSFAASLPDGPFDGAYSVTVFQHLSAEVCAQLVADVMVRAGSFVFQYVEGTEDAFLSHQASEAMVREWCEGFDVHIEPDPEHEQWRWATVR